jgi:hypothetical protein
MSHESALLLLELSDPTPFVAGDTRSVALIDLSLLDPVAQRLGIDPELLADPAQRPRPCRGFTTRVDRQPEVAFRSSSGYFLSAAMTLLTRSVQPPDSEKCM